MRTPAHDTALQISSDPAFGSFGGSGAWAVYVGREPLFPVNVVTVYDTGGGGAVLVPDLRNPSIQVRVRSATYDAGWEKANQAYEALARQTQSSVPDAVILAWTAQGDINYIGRDDKDRPLFAVNFSVMRDGAGT